MLSTTSVRKILQIMCNSLKTLSVARAIENIGIFMSHQDVVVVTVVVVTVVVVVVVVVAPAAAVLSLLQHRSNTHFW